jgi:hypothetical protein
MRSAPSDAARVYRYWLTTLVAAADAFAIVTYLLAAIDTWHREIALFVKVHVASFVFRAVADYAASSSAHRRMSSSALSLVA